MLTKIGQVEPNTLKELTEHCQKLKPLMTKDVSKYAKKRYRLWLFHEALLTKQRIKPAHFDQRLWNFTQRIHRGGNIALLAFGGEIAPDKISDARILWHRDDTYAQDWAYGVNFGGQAIFGYNTARDSSDPQAQTVQRIRLEPGDIYRFHCKHQHAVLDHEPGRFSLNIWTVKTDLTRYPGLALDPKIAQLLCDQPARQ